MTVHSQTNELKSTSKRTTLKTLSGLAAVSALATVPGLNALAASVNVNHSNSGNLPIHLEGKLVSIPNVRGETLLLKNVTDQDIQIDNFQVNKILFDGEVVDCNDACDTTSIQIPAKNDVMIRFKPRHKNQLNTPAGEFLNLDSQVWQLPAGTRVVPLAAHMNGNAAILMKQTLTA